MTVPKGPLHRFGAGRRSRRLWWLGYALVLLCVIAMIVLVWLGKIPVRDRHHTLRLLQLHTAGTKPVLPRRIDRSIWPSPSHPYPQPGRTSRREALRVRVAKTILWHAHGQTRKNSIRLCQIRPGASGNG